jgi:hypothetical protein
MTEESRLTYATKFHQIAVLILMGALPCFSMIARVRAQAPQAPENASTPTFQVQQIDPNFDVQKMAGPGVKIHTREELRGKNTKLPTTEFRDSCFSKAGLQASVRHWDQLDKDHLFVSARDATPERLSELYPKLSKDKLLALSRLVKETDNSK